MVEIIINDNITSIKTNDIQVIIEGDFQIKKEGAEAPVINVASVYMLLEFEPKRIILLLSVFLISENLFKNKC